VNEILDTILDPGSQPADFAALRDPDLRARHLTEINRFRNE
jgi:hypothetical protein